MKSVLKDAVTAPSPGDGMRAAELRAAFDRAFAEPVRVDQDDRRVAVLALRAGADACVVRLSEVRGLQARPTITPLPTPVSDLLGLAWVRGALVPVYSLAALQGQPVPREMPAWMILVEGEDPVGLGFEELLAYVKLDRSEIAVPPVTKDGVAGAPDVSPAARVGDALRPLIDVPTLVAGLRRRAFAARAQKQE